MSWIGLSRQTGYAPTKKLPFLFVFLVWFQIIIFLVTLGNKAQSAKAKATWRLKVENQQASSWQREIINSKLMVCMTKKCRRVWVRSVGFSVRSQDTCLSRESRSVAWQVPERRPLLSRRLLHWIFTTWLFLSSTRVCVGHRLWSNALGSRLSICLHLQVKRIDWKDGHQSVRQAIRQAKMRVCVACVWSGAGSQEKEHTATSSKGKITIFASKQSQSSTLEGHVDLLSGPEKGGNIPHVASGLRQPQPTRCGVQIGNAKSNIFPFQIK